MSRLVRFCRTLAVGIAATGLMLSTTQVAGAAQEGPSVPAAIAVRAGHKVFLVGHATGVQSYKCNKVSLTWETASTPDAKLTDDKGELVATHFGGPTWQARDGSTVVGARVEGVAVAGTIPLLLLRAASTAPGPDGDQFVKTTFIQRVKTTGGVGPVGSCAAGETRDVPYTADYYFWKATGSA
jgi:hypothetical protein